MQKIQVNLVMYELRKSPPSSSVYRNEVLKSSAVSVL